MNRMNQCHYTTGQSTYELKNAQSYKPKNKAEPSMINTK
jgi:hypothetical protein